jgi:hypothetical protein
VIGGLYASASEAEAAVRRAVERGIRYFDTAPHYGAGRAERRLSAAMSALDGRAPLLSGDPVISTKVCRRLVPLEILARAARLRDGLEQATFELGLSFGPADEQHHAALPRGLKCSSSPASGCETRPPQGRAREHAVEASAAAFDAAFGVNKENTDD